MDILPITNMHSRFSKRNKHPFFAITVLYLLFLSNSNPLIADITNLKFTHLTIDDGLSHSKVNCIFQDRRGMIWFGTNEGLNKYDGYDFTIYQLDPESPFSLSANLIRCIFEDSQDRFWIGTEAGGLNLYDRAMNRFHSFTNDSTSELILSSSDVNDILEDREGNLWLGTGDGIDKIRFDSKVISHYRPYPDVRRSGMNQVNVLHTDEDNNLWIGTGNGGLCMFDKQKNKFYTFQHRDTDPRSISDNDVRSIYEDKDGYLWIGTYNGGLNLFDRENKIFRRFYPNKNILESLTIKSILEDKSGKLWLGTRNGLYFFDLKSHRFDQHVNDPKNMYSLIQNNVETFFQDAKGDLWIGTWGGISYLNSNNIPFYHYRAEINSNRHLNHNVVYAILEDRLGDIWFGTEEGGLNHLNTRTERFTHYCHNPLNPQTLSSNNIKTLIEDRNGDIWVGTWQGGVDRFDQKQKRFIRYRFDPEESHTILTPVNVYAILEDTRGKIWIGTEKNGLFFYNRTESSFIRKARTGTFLDYKKILTLYEDSEGIIWIGSDESRICAYNPNSGTSHHYQLDIPLSGIEVRTIMEDKKGDIWFCTVGGGLHALDKGTNLIQAYTKKDGFSSNITYGILEDDHENLWISTTNGLMKFNPEQDQVKIYYKENGLQSNQFTYGHYKSRNGKMYFGGINGVTAFHPDSIVDNTYIPPVVITNFSILNKPVVIGGKDSILQKDISETQSITLSHKHSVFSFDFAALNYCIPQQNQYAYMLEGFDKQWNYIGTRRHITYTNMGKGHYTLSVKAANNDGVWNEEGVSLQIRITPIFYETIWFRLLAVLMIAFIIKHIYDDRKRRRNLLKANALANLAQIKLLRNQMNPHFLFNALGSIRSMILINTEQAWEMISALSEFFRYTLVNFNKVESVLNDEIDAVKNYLKIENIRYKDTLKVKYKIASASRQCHVPTFLFQPLIENAIKHGMATSHSMPLRISIDIRYQDQVLSIDVSNTGNLDESNESDEKDAGMHGTSLENIRKRLELLFKDQYQFILFEEKGWVHAKIRIHYVKTTDDDEAIIPEATELLA